MGVGLLDLVPALNCYYRKLIAGHDTYPVDIERALKGDYSHDAIDIVGAASRWSRPGRSILSFVDPTSSR
jgi:hypothetical protein